MTHSALIKILSDQVILKGQSLSNLLAVCPPFLAKFWPGMTLFSWTGMTCPTSDPQSHWSASSLCKYLLLHHPLMFYLISSVELSKTISKTSTARVSLFHEAFSWWLNTALRRHTLLLFDDTSVKQNDESKVLLTEGLVSLFLFNSSVRSIVYYQVPNQYRLLEKGNGIQIT